MGRPRLSRRYNDAPEIVKSFVNQRRHELESDHSQFNKAWRLSAIVDAIPKRKNFKKYAGDMPVPSQKMWHKAGSF
ncbi:MAG: hypothetical protein H0U27_09010 [Nitrosopumilus sp.]|nr:hypothetical protein [Nitrosopumilus sp.]